MKETLPKGLEKCKLFCGLSATEINDIVSNAGCRVVKIPASEIYATEGAVCSNTDIILKGSMAVRMMGDGGRQLDLIRLQEGDIVAICYLYGSRKEIPACIEAETDTTLLRISKSAFRRLIDSNQAVRWNYVSVLSDLTTFFASHIKFLSLLTVRQKLLRYLRQEFLMQRSMKLTLRKSRQELADMFAVQKYSIQRIFAMLAGEGIIAVDGKTVTILDTSRLR